MRLRLPISLLGLALAGCTTLVAPNPPSAPSDLARYFWPAKDTVLTYQSDSGKHTISTTKGGPVTDAGPSSVVATFLTITRSASGVSVSGLSTNDIFSLDPELQIVSQDTPNVSKNSLAVQSIAGIGPNLYFATSTNLFLNHPGQPPENLGALPVGDMKLYGDVGGDMLYAVHYFGDEISYRAANTPYNGSWVTVTGNGNDISAFSPQADRGDPDHVSFWAASGVDLYQYRSEQDRTHSQHRGPQLPGNITAMEWQRPKSGDPFLLAGLSNGLLYSLGIPDQGPLDLQFQYDFQPGLTITSIEEGLVGSTNGLYDGFRGWGQITGSAPVVCMLDAGPLSTFVSHITGEIVWYSNAGIFPVQSSYGFPNGSSPATQLAFTILSQHGRTVSDLYALIGTDLYHRNADSAANWSLLNFATTGTAQWPVGAFTLLSNGVSTWQAGYALRSDIGSPKVFTYNATCSAASTVVLDGVTHPDVIMVKYVGSDGIDADASLVPQYLIYYQGGIGPIRIEKTENSQTVVTRLTP